MDIAIDIIFTLPKNIRHQLIQISQEIESNKNEKIDLGEKKNVPHISLWMGIISKNDLDRIQSELNRFFQEQTFPILQPEELIVFKSPTHDILSLNIQKTKDLLFWHQSVCDIATKYRLQKTAHSTHFSENNVILPALNYVDTFEKSHAASAYDPHITIGFGNSTKQEKFTEFYPQSLAIYQLGNYCRCSLPIHQFNSTKE